MTALLEIRDVTLRFGGISALTAVSLTIDEGEIVGLIGPNGAGKTSLFNVVSRLYHPQEGEVEFEGYSLLDKADHQIAGLAIGRTFQNIALFPSLTILENVALGYFPNLRTGVLAALTGRASSRREQREVYRQAREALESLELGEYESESPTDLPPGILRQVELARALVSKPRMLLLDEPAAGLNHEELTAVGALVKNVNQERGIAVLVIEHRMDFVMPLADRIVVLDFGEVIASGRWGRFALVPARQTFGCR